MTVIKRTSNGFQRCLLNLAERKTPSNKEVGPAVFKAGLLGCLEAVSGKDVADRSVKASDEADAKAAKPKKDKPKNN